MSSLTCRQPEHETGRCRGAGATSDQERAVTLPHRRGTCGRHSS